MVVSRPEEEILAELRAEQARDRVRAQDQAGWRRGGLSAPKTTPTAVGPGPEPVPGRPGTWRMATFEQQQLIVDLMERHVVPPERVERVQAVIDGRDPCPPTLIDWLMTLPWRESRCTADGLTGPQIAERAGCTEPTVVKWRRQYAEDGLAGLEDAPGLGGPKTVMR